MRIIAHLDMDAFFAAIEERDTPCWQGLPIVVGANPRYGRGRGVVSTANYKAREYGIYSALPISKAWQLSELAKKRGEPAIIFVEPDIEKYERVSEEIFKIVKDVLTNFSHATKNMGLYKIEQASIDEMYLDLSFAGAYDKAIKICKEIKRKIKEQKRLTCSIGIGPNKLITKIASDQQKPDGLTVIGDDDRKRCDKIVNSFLEAMPIRVIPGIGLKTESKLRELGVVLVRDLKRVSLKELKEKFGKRGIDMYYKARGVDDSPVEENFITKSISEQKTFLKNTFNLNFIIENLELMCENIVRRLKEEGFRIFKTVTITVRFADFETKTSSHTLPEPTSSLKVLKREAIKLLMPFFDKRKNPQKKFIRLVGIRLEKID